MKSNGFEEICEPPNKFTTLQVFKDVDVTVHYEIVVF